MNEFKLTLASAVHVTSQLIDLARSNKTYRVVVSEWREKRSLSQNALQHVIYSDVSEYLISKGRKHCTTAWVKSALKNQFLGWTETEFTDLNTGEITNREVLRSTKDLDVGESCHYTTQILDWAQSIGCSIKIPAKCEYRDMLNKQNE